MRAALRLQDPDGFADGQQPPGAFTEHVTVDGESTVIYPFTNKFVDDLIQKQALNEASASTEASALTEASSSTEAAVRPKQRLRLRLRLRPRKRPRLEARL